VNGLQGDNTHCFELFGFDILLDSDLRPWLLEVNVCPLLSSGSKLDKQVKTALMCDLFTLVGAPLPGEAPLREQTADQELLQSLSEEFSRTGAFDLLFPLRRNVDYYTQFFHKQRRSNWLVWRALKSHKLLGCN
jgi:hypothetical protein